MTWLVASVGCLGLAVYWGANPSLMRLRRWRNAPKSRGSSGPVNGWSVFLRAAVGIASGAALAALWPSLWGAGLGVVAGLGTALAMGYIPRPDPALERVRREFPEALDLLSVSMTAGASLQMALSVAIDVGPPETSRLLSLVAADQRLGRPDPWQRLIAHPVWAEAARDLSRAARSGTPVEHSLRIHAEQARRREQERATTAARAVGVKSVGPLMVCYLPAFILVGVVPIIVGLASQFFQ